MNYALLFEAFAIASVTYSPAQPALAYVGVFVCRTPCAHIKIEIPVNSCTRRKRIQVLDSLRPKVESSQDFHQFASPAQLGNFFRDIFNSRKMNGWFRFEEEKYFTFGAWFVVEVERAWAQRPGPNLGLQYISLSL